MIRHGARWPSTKSPTTIRDGRTADAASNAVPDGSSEVWRPIRDLKVEPVAVSALKPYAGNARTHSKKQIRQIAESIRTFGWTNPVLIDEGRRVVAGHGRLEAAKLLGLDQVPAIRLGDLSDAQVRAYIIADNRLAELAGWDEELLSIELKALTEIELDFDIEVTGFETAEIDGLIIGPVEPDDEADRVPEIDPDAKPLTSTGDLWQLGPHRLLCGDATDPRSFEKLLDGEEAQLVFTDPPYNVPIDGNVSGLGRIRHREFVMGSGEMSEAEYADFLETALRLMRRYSRDGAIHFICMDWRHIRELLTVGNDVYTELKNLCIWNKTNGGMGAFYRSKHELVAVFKAGTGPHVNNVELGTYGRNRTNVWDYAGVNSFGSDRDVQLAMHPTVKPAAMVADAILDCSRRGGLVLDPFSGSGTTIIAAERVGRRAHAIEIDPRYVDATLRRYREFSGRDPVHLDSGLALSELD